MIEFIKNLPKAELHVHIEGTLEPEMMFEFAKRNNVKLPYQQVEDVKRAYEFDNLQSFLDLYYLGTQVLVKEKDFYELTMAYMKRCSQNNILHCEIFFDPQAHTERGVNFATVINGITKALADAKIEWGISSNLILCFLRHLSADSAMETLYQSLPYQKHIIAVGLDSSELGHPPEKFEKVFAQAIEEGYKTVAHAGEEGPAQYITDSLDKLNVSRIDHGVRCTEDADLVQRLVDIKMPLTVCPLSNVKLKVFDSMEKHNVLKLLKKGLKVSIHSDDPAYFGGYLNDNFIAVYEALNMTRKQAVKLAKNSFKSSFLPKSIRIRYIHMIEDYFEQVKLAELAELDGEAA
jgi:adenosine deaminase